MNAQPSSLPEIVAFCLKIGPVPALVSAQMNIETKQIGTRIDWKRGRIRQTERSGWECGRERHTFSLKNHWIRLG